MFDIRDHPEAAEFDELGEHLVEPVPWATIRDHRVDGLSLREINLLEHVEVDAYVELEGPAHSGMDIGTVLYRLVELFGAPPFPEYQAGNDISWRTNETFKYLLPIRQDGVSEGSGHLLTVHDWQARLGVSLTAWDRDPMTTVDDFVEAAITSLAIAHNVVTEPVRCEYEEVWF